MRKIITFLLAVLANCFAGGLIGAVVGISPLAGALAANAVSLLAGAFLSGVPGLHAGVLTEIWTGELVKALRRGLEGSWLKGIPDMTSLVNNDVIHLVDVGVDPDVLINNSTYPIDVQELEDGDISISLDKFQTKATPITDDELYAISYDKMARVKESHANAINDSKYQKAAHAFCAAENTDDTPLLKTTGEADTSTGRLAMTRADLIDMKKALDALGVPASGRRLVLCSDHVNDMLGWSEEFAKQYSLNNQEGTVGRIYGFDVYESVDNPTYSTDGVKNDVGTEAGTGEFQCSFAFYSQRAFVASGSTKMYYSEAKNDPEYQRNLVNFRHYFIALPKKADCAVTLMSAYDSTAITA